MINKIVIVGGGAAGWLTASLFAANYANGQKGLAVTLVESPDVKNIGVGEGTWPSMRQTLQKIGISENEFLRCCEASFKQGSLFKGWQYGGSDSYYHPFTEPLGIDRINLADHLALAPEPNFDRAVSAQSDVADQYLAPKQLSTPEFACVLNYGYHLNSAAFIALLHKHATIKLGVQYISAHVDSVKDGLDGNIASLRLSTGDSIDGDLFIDCSGLHSLLIEKHYGIAWHSVKSQLFNDTALAVQVPYPESDHTIQSCTVATAQHSGWIWDIGLTSRRGIGHVFSRDYDKVDEVEKRLRQYIAKECNQPNLSEQLACREIRFDPGYRQVFWHKNCVAIGMSAGFIEPLEASALVLVEMAANFICEEMPSHKAMVPFVAKRFNRVFSHYWQQIVDFLKLHYVLNKREDSDYWLNHQSKQTCSSSLQDMLEQWHYRSPWHGDELLRQELFPIASYQYVLFGMGYSTGHERLQRRFWQTEQDHATKLFAEKEKLAQKLCSNLPTNRYLLNRICLN